MNLIPFLFLLISLGATAQENQCPIPGQVLARELIRLSGEEVKKDFFREGNLTAPADGFLKGEISAKTFKNYRETFCLAKEFTFEETVCEPVPLGDALGRGNEILRSLFDMNLPLLSRAEVFAKNVAFFNEAPSAERLSFSRQIVVSLGRQASISGIPKSWDSFSNMLSSMVTGGDLPQSVLDQITTVNLENNKKALGFRPMDGTTISEGKGNGKLQRFFNLQLSIKVRSDLIRNTLIGVSESTSQKLSVSFIDFASSNGIPVSWDQFLLLMKASLAAGAIPETEFAAVLTDNETENRMALGFEQSAEICKNVVRTRMVNVLEKRVVQDFFQNVLKNFEIEISKAPLLNGEREEYNVTFDGLSQVALNSTTRFNSYLTSNYSDENGLVKFKVAGTRNQVTPRNNIGAGIKRNGKLINVVLQNKDFSPMVGGRVLVNVDIYEEISSWPDRFLGSKVFELNNGDMGEFASQISLRNPDRKIRLDVSVQVLGSVFFNNRWSKVLEFNGL